MMRGLLLVVAASLVGCGGGGGSQPLFLFQGNGTFGAPFSVLVDPGNEMNDLILGDFNGDGIPDVATTNVMDDTVSILLGNGDGTFTAVTPKIQLAGTGTQGVAGRFNQDSAVDLVVNDFSNHATWFLAGNGDGTFAAPVSVGGIPPLASPIPIVADRFDGNQTLDLAIGLYSSEEVLILLGNGDGTFTSAVPATLPMGGPPGDLATADFDRDGQRDFAALISFSPTIRVHMGSGDGSFGFAAFGYLGPDADGIRLTVSDFNQDELPDIAVLTTAVDARVLLGIGNGVTALAPYPPRLPSGFGDIVAGNFDADGLPDLVVGTAGAPGPTVIEVLLGTGDGGFRLPSPPATRSTSSVREVEVADLNRDGVLDLLLNTDGSDSVRVFLGNRR